MDDLNATQNSLQAFETLGQFLFYVLALRRTPVILSTLPASERCR